MTTSDDTGGTTTPTEPTGSRSIEELLKLDKYEGLSDAEVRLLMQYDHDKGYSEGKADSDAASIDKQTQVITERAQASLDAANTNFQDALNLVAKFQEVS